MVVKTIKISEDCYSKRERVVLDIIDKKLQWCWDNLKKFTKEEMEKVDEKHFPKPIEKPTPVIAKKDIEKQYYSNNNGTFKKMESAESIEKVDILMVDDNKDKSETKSKRKLHMIEFRKILDALEQGEIHVDDLAVILERSRRVLYKWNETTTSKFLNCGVVDIILLKKYLDKTL